jgi:hypothetical protein
MSKGRKKITINPNDKFGELTVIKEIEPIKYGKQNFRRFLCKCNCGNHWSGVLLSLRNGDAVTCGCGKFKRKTNLKHNEAMFGKTITAEYRTWCAMKRRCYNPNVNNYMNYGGRGIIVCDRWINSYENFLEDMGRKPSIEYSIDRIDNNGNYEPSNCRWVTPKEQRKNQRKYNYGSK